MYFADEGFLLLARGGRTPHTLPLHRSRDDPGIEAARRELRSLIRVLRQSPAQTATRRAAGAAGRRGAARQRAA